MDTSYNPMHTRAARYIGKSREIGNDTNISYKILVSLLICHTFANLRYICYEILVTDTIILISTTNMGQFF